MPHLSLVSAVNETDRIRIMTFSDPCGAPLCDYTPGAHIDFILGESGKRSYSLIDWPALEKQTDVYTIAVQYEEAGEGGSKAMHALNAGDVVEICEPCNNFQLKAGQDPVLLLAGGIGVTPLISMATDLNRRGVPFQFHYSARSRAMMGFEEKLSRAFPDHMHFYFDDCQPLILDQILQDQKQDTQIYICGPKGMVDAARAAAFQAGYADDAVHVELFSAPQTDSADQPFEVEIKDTGEVFTIPVGMTIIEVLEKAGKDLMFDCKRGDCGICQTDVLEGIPDHRDVVLSKVDRDLGKVMQICVSRAKSSRLVLDL